VVVADQTVVINQLKTRLELRDVAGEIGLFYAGKRPSGELVVVGSIQSLAPPSSPPKPPKQGVKETEKAFERRLGKWEIKLKAHQTRKKNVKMLRQYVKDAQMVLVDECDKATGDSWKGLFRHCFKGRRRYGYSGTPFDPSKPVQGMVMQEHLGSVIAKTSRARLEKIGRIIACEYWMFGFGSDGDIHEASAYDLAYDEWMVSNERFHRLVALICKKYKGEGTLILVDRRALGSSLEQSIRAAGLTANFIHGDTTQRRRDEMLRQFESRAFDVLIGGKIINRGLDLHGGCENLVIATGGKLQSELIQKIGRALRQNKLGRSRVFDFYFRCNRYLYAHSKARLRAMVEAGYRTTVVFPGGSIDGGQLIQSRFRVGKRLLEEPAQRRLIPTS
jgi:superfamily II DNA or RNA helicase